MGVESRLGGMQGSYGRVHLPLWPAFIFWLKLWLPDVGELKMLAALAALLPASQKYLSCAGTMQ